MKRLLDPGNQKDNKASLQRHFDQRDELFEKLHAEELIDQSEIGL